jgi:DNA-binding transcriptional MerR regulator
MMTGLPGSSEADPRTTLRSYRGSAPWRLRDLATLASTLLEHANITPVSSAASALPTERTIRFYVARGLVNPPEGRGTAATYSYRHLLQVLAIKLRQMEGATLERMAEEFRDTPGDVLEHRVATSLGTLPPLSVALHRLKSGARTVVSGPAPGARPGRAIRRVALGPGVELLIDESHPAWHDRAQLAALSARVAETLTSLQDINPQN